MGNSSRPQHPGGTAINPTGEAGTLLTQLTRLATANYCHARALSEAKDGVRLRESIIKEGLAMDLTPTPHPLGVDAYQHPYTKN